MLTMNKGALPVWRNDCDSPEQIASTGFGWVVNGTTKRH